MISSQPLRAELIEWFDGRRQATAGLFRLRGWPAGVSSTVDVINFSQNGWFSGVHEKEVSPFAGDFGGLVFAEIPDELLLAGSETLAERLLAAYGRNCAYRTLVLADTFPGGVPGEPVPLFEDGPNRWIRQFLLWPALRWYLSELRSLEDGDDDLAAQIADELIVVVGDAHLVVCCSIPLCRLVTDEPRLQAENLTLRALTAVEAGRYLRHLGTPFRLTGGVLSTGWTGWEDPPSHVLEVRTLYSKHADPDCGVWPERVLLALQLVDPKLRGPGSMTVRVEPNWLPFAVAARDVTLPKGEPVARSSRVTLADLVHALALAQHIAEGAVGEPAGKADVALHRFSLALARQSETDQIIDCVVALEALLNPEGSTNELRYRFSLYGAVYLDPGPERERLFKQFQALYDIRSRLVHGSAKFPSTTQLKEHAELALRLTRRALRQALLDGWPAGERLQALALGITNDAIG